MHMHMHVDHAVCTAGTVRKRLLVRGGPGGEGGSGRGRERAVARHPGKAGGACNKHALHACRHACLAAWCACVLRVLQPRGLRNPHAMWQDRHTWHWVGWARPSRPRPPRPTWTRARMRGEGLEGRAQEHPHQVHVMDEMHIEPHQSLNNKCPIPQAGWQYDAGRSRWSRASASDA